MVPESVPTLLSPCLPPSGVPPDVLLLELQANAKAESAGTKARAKRRWFIPAAYRSARRAASLVTLDSWRRARYTAARMSIKRTKQRSFNGGNGGGGRDNEDDSPFSSKKSEPEKTWTEHVEGKPDDGFTPYNMSHRFDKGALVSHGKFGKGVVVGVEPQRIEVLFQDGMKKLGHGA